MQIKKRTEIEVLESIETKIELLILVSSLSGKNKKEQIKILKSYDGNLSKRELERVSGVDRHEF